jgi:hypothetical protein
VSQHRSGDRRQAIDPPRFTLLTLLLPCCMLHPPNHRAAGCRRRCCCTHNCLAGVERGAASVCQLQRTRSRQRDRPQVRATRGSLWRQQQGGGGSQPAEVAARLTHSCAAATALDPHTPHTHTRQTQCAGCRRQSCCCGLQAQAQPEGALPGRPGGRAQKLAQGGWCVCGTQRDPCWCAVLLQLAATSLVVVIPAVWLPWRSALCHAHTCAPLTHTPPTFTHGRGWSWWLACSWLTTWASPWGSCP